MFAARYELKFCTTYYIVLFRWTSDITAVKGTKKIMFFTQQLHVFPAPLIMEQKILMQLTTDTSCVVDSLLARKDKMAD